MDKHCLSATTHLPACLPACLPGCSPATAHLPATAYLPACLFTTCLCLPAYLPACSPATALQVEEVVAENEALRVSLKHASDSQARQAGTERQVINVAASPLLAEENDLLRQVRVLRLVRARRGRAGIGGEMWGLISGRPCMTHGPALPCMTHGHVPCMTHDPALCPCLAQENDLLVQQQSELDSEIVRLHRQMEDQAQAGMRSAQEQAVLSSRLQQATSLVQVRAGDRGAGADCGWVGGMHAWCVCVRVCGLCVCGCVRVCVVCVRVCGVCACVCVWCVCVFVHPTLVPPTPSLITHSGQLHSCSVSLRKYNQIRVIP